MTKPKSGSVAANSKNSPDCTLMSCKTTADSDGEKSSVAEVLATLQENARALVHMVGRQVLVTSTTGKTECNLASLTLKPNKDKPSLIVGKGKLKGGPALEKMVGRSVQIQIAQLDLPGTGKKDGKSAAAGS